jgi:hypothetical protein
MSLTSVAQLFVGVTWIPVVSKATRIANDDARN